MALWPFKAQPLTSTFTSGSPMGDLWAGQYLADPPASNSALLTGLTPRSETPAGLLPSNTGLPNLNGNALPNANISNGNSSRLLLNLPSYQNQNQVMTGSATSDSSSPSYSAAQAENEQVYYLIVDLLNPNTRESALLELSKKREQWDDLALVLWHSYGA